MDFSSQNTSLQVTLIAFNGEVLCRGKPFTGEGLRNLVVSAHHDKENCGIQTLARRRNKIIGSEFPWLVALFRKKKESYSYQCTGTLITERHVITAAQCVFDYATVLFPKEDLLLVLGRSDITKWVSKSGIERTSIEITPHPKYKRRSSRCDVAIITMNEKVPIKPTVLPICLWNFDPTLRHIVGKNGAVVGWGKAGEKSPGVSVARKVSLPVVSEETCLRSHPAFRNLLSETTFCVGRKDGSGPCSGDSGAGFIMKRGSRWYLRGTVSTAIADDNLSCNLHEYVVFADVAVLKDWIQDVIKEK